MLFTDALDRPDPRSQAARARAIRDLDIEAEQVMALLRIVRKQRLLLERLIWVRENLDTLDQLRAVSPAAVPFDWPALLDTAVAIPDEEGQLDELNTRLGLAPPPPAVSEEIVGIAPPAASPQEPAGPEYLVVRVWDGGTIELAGGQRVRYIGVDSPGMRNVRGEPDAGAWAAREANRRLVAQRRVRLEADALDADADGAWWRYVYVDGLLVNTELLRQGAVFAMNRYPNNRLVERLMAAEQDARRHKRGVWKD